MPSSPAVSTMSKPVAGPIISSRARPGLSGSMAIGMKFALPTSSTKQRLRAISPFQRNGEIFQAALKVGRGDPPVEAFEEARFVSRIDADHEIGSLIALRAGDDFAVAVQPADIAAGAMR